MSILRGIGLQFFAEPAVGDPAPGNDPASKTPSQTGTTPPQAANVDIDKITQDAAQKAIEAAERKTEAVFKSMLQQQGLDAETINKMTAEWKSKQKTPEDIAKEKDEEIMRLTGELTAAQNRADAAAKGIPSDKIADYVTLAAAQEGKDFAEKLDTVLAKFPLKNEAPPQYAAGTGSSNMLGGSGSTSNLAETNKQLNSHRLIK